jgi:hypothetical protein
MIEKKPNHGSWPGRNFAGAKEAAEKGAIRGLRSRLSVAGAKEAAEKGQFIDRNG